jgi:hypothetical protein
MPRCSLRGRSPSWAEPGPAAAAGLDFRIIPAGFIPLRDKSLTGFNAPLEFLTGFTSKYIVFVGQAFRPAYCKAEALPYEM